MKKFAICLMILTIILPLKSYASETKDEVSLSSCVDGDSARFMLGVGEIKVKFIGIESSKELIDKETGEIDENLVSNYVCDALKGAKKITIEYEPSADREDKYGRIQAWVYVDDILLQEDLINLGYAKIMYLEDNYLYSDKLKSAQKEAREKGIGMWESKPIEPSKDEEEPVVEEKKSKGFFGTIIDFIVDVFRAIIEFIDGIINNIL